MIEIGIVSLIRATQTITTLVADRIFAVLVPPSATYPCLSYTTMTKPPKVAVDRSAVETKRVQFDCWAKDYGSAKALQASLRALLDGYQGILPDGTKIIIISRDTEADFFENDADTFRAMSEYLITYPAGQ